MPGIASNIASLKKQIPDHIKLIAVSKTMPVDSLLEAYKEGQRAFGENRVQELLSKKDELPEDIEWHFIGHLQTNKVKYVVPFVSMIQSVDSFKLLRIIDNEAKKINRIIDCLLQFHIAQEETKFGFSIDEAVEIMESGSHSQLDSVRLRGVMGMATLTDDISLVRNEFRKLAEYYQILKKKYFRDISTFSEISMGMSGDYRIAIEEGSTMVRIGSVIFGERM